MAVLKGHGPCRGARKAASDGGTIWWVAPTYNIAEMIWWDLKKATHYARDYKSETDRRITLPGGGSVSVKSADNPDSLRGAGLDGLVVDEAAFITQQAWQEALRPSLSDRKGWAIFISTPNGMNWFHDLFLFAGRDQPDWAAWQRPTSDNSVIDPEEIEAARQDSSPRVFLQEYEAQFVTQEGAEFPAYYFRDEIFVDSMPPGYVCKVLALDPSKGKESGGRHKGDYQAFVFATLGQDGLLYIDARIGHWNLDEQAQMAVDFCSEFGPDVFGVETLQFQQLLADNIDRMCRRRGIHNRAMPIEDVTRKEIRIRRLTPYLGKSEIRFVRSPGTKLLVSQLQEFPHGKFDDGPDALEMAVRLAHQVMRGHENLPEEYV